MNDKARAMANPLGSNKPKKYVPAGGYTKPDRAVRCPKCFVGQDEGGNGIGTPIARYTASCALPEGGSVAVAHFARCYKCGTFAGYLRRTEQARKLGITFMGLMGCLKSTRPARLPDFTLDELRAGKVEQVKEPPDISAPKPVEREEIYNPEEEPGTEQEAMF